MTYVISARCRTGAVFCADTFFTHPLEGECHMRKVTQVSERVVAGVAGEVPCGGDPFAGMRDVAPHKYFPRAGLNRRLRHARKADRAYLEEGMFWGIEGFSRDRRATLGFLIAARAGQDVALYKSVRVKEMFTAVRSYGMGSGACDEAERVLFRLDPKASQAEVLDTLVGALSASMSRNPRRRDVGEQEIQGLHLSTFSAQGYRELVYDPGFCG